MIGRVAAAVKAWRNYTRISRAQTLPCGCVLSDGPYAGAFDFICLEHLRGRIVSREPLDNFDGVGLDARYEE